MASCRRRVQLARCRDVTAMIYWTGLPDLDERFDEPDVSGARSERSIAGRRARLVRWSLLLWASQILVMALFFAFT